MKPPWGSQSGKERFQGPDAQGAGSLEDSFGGYHRSEDGIEKILAMSDDDGVKLWILMSENLKDRRIWERAKELAGHAAETAACCNLSSNVKMRVDCVGHPDAVLFDIKHEWMETAHPSYDELKKKVKNTFRHRRTDIDELQ